MADSGGGDNDKKNEPLWRNLAVTSDRDGSSSRRATEAHVYTNDQMDDIYRDFGDSPLSAQQTDQEKAGIPPLDCLTFSSGVFFRKVLSSILPGRLRANQKFRRFLRTLSNELGHLLNALLVREDTQISYHVAASKVFYIYTEIRQEADLENIDVFIDIVRKRLTMHVANLAKSTQVIDWCVSLSNGLSPQNVMILAQHVQKLDVDNEHIQDFSFEITNMILELIAQFILDNLSRLSNRDLKHLVNISPTLQARVGNASGEEPSVCVLDEIFNEIHGRLDVSGWATTVMNRERETLQNIFHQLFYASLPTVIDKSVISAQYDRLIDLFESVKSSLSYPVVGPLAVLMSQMQTQMLEIAIKPLSDEQVQQIMRCTSLAILNLLRDESGADSRLAVLIDECMKKRFQ